LDSTGWFKTEFFIRFVVAVDSVDEEFDDTEAEKLGEDPTKWDSDVEAPFWMHQFLIEENIKVYNLTILSCPELREHKLQLFTHTGEPPKTANHLVITVK
jgi:hypothetical protein